TMGDLATRGGLGPFSTHEADGLGVLSHAVLALRSTADLGTACTLVGEGLVRALGAAECCVLRIDMRSGSLRILADGGVETPYHAEPTGPIEWLLRHESPHFDDGTDDPNAAREALLWNATPSAISAVPLFASGRLAGGLLVAFPTPKLFTPEDRRLLQTVADALALALERTELHDALEDERSRRVELERQHTLDDEVSSNLMSVVAHEIRTPLTAIKAYTETLLESLHDPKTPRERFLSIINEECDRLSRLVTDVLDLSRLEAGQRPLRLTAFPLRDLLDDVIAGLAPLARARQVGVQIEFKRELQVESDRDLLQRLFVNLLSNALKFSPAGAVVRVIAEAEGDRWLAWVIDEGPGIPADDLPRVFERFYRVRRPSDMQIEGTGLGLAIARGIVDLHGGRLWAETPPEGGTRFCLSLPLRQMATPAARRIARSVASRADLRQLLDATVEMVAAVMDAGIVSLMLVDADRGDLYIAASRGLEGQKITTRRTTVRSGVAGTVAAWAKPVLVGNIETDRRFARLNHPQYSTKSFLSVPLVVEGEVLGVINVNNKRSTSSFDEHDLGVLVALIERVGSAIERANAYPDHSHNVLEAIEALRGVTRYHLESDSLLRGHVRHTRLVARTLELSDREVDLLGYVAAIHDVGMAPIAREIDRVPGPLSDAERDRLIKHPEASVDLMRPLEYMASVREIILAHHERWDGGGYPLGLAAEAIPIGARILAVVDAWESMISNRLYRPARTEPEALEELRAESGRQFDPSVVEALVKVIARDRAAA
ncbi:MAG: GAF domain-containing protein, partial [Candidatus Eisenbacteria bacterium]|nr:GAF domain-containing protein [Candidatus Eisenbacteria bacterium]